MDSSRAPDQRTEEENRSEGYNDTGNHEVEDYEDGNQSNDEEDDEDEHQDDTEQYNKEDEDGNQEEDDNEDDAITFKHIPIANVEQRFVNIGVDPAAFVALDQSQCEACADATMVLLDGVYGITLEVTHGGVSSVPPTTPLGIINLSGEKWQLVLG